LTEGETVSQDLASDIKDVVENRMMTVSQFPTFERFSSKLRTRITRFSFSDIHKFGSVVSSQKEDSSKFLMSDPCPKKRKMQTQPNKQINMWSKSFNRILPRMTFVLLYVLVTLSKKLFS
jgi:hypothetical protein